MGKIVQSEINGYSQTSRVILLVANYDTASH
jgi:hypothetical protein